MINNFRYFFTSAYLLQPVTGTKLELFYLYFPAAIFILVIGFRIFLFIKGGRPDAYRRFDGWWFWGYLSLALFGIFIWFSRNQSLPLFSTRLVSYLWLLSLGSFTVFLMVYFLRSLPKKLTEYFEKQRKSKYLGK